MQGIDVENNIGLWSESIKSDITTPLITILYERTRSKMWPWMWVESIIHWTIKIQDKRSNEAEEILW